MDKKIFGERLKYLMDLYDETTYSLAKTLGLSAPTISRYTRGEMEPKTTTVQVLSEYFNVALEWLNGDNVGMYPQTDSSQLLDSSFDTELAIFNEISYDLPIFSNEKDEKSKLTVNSENLNKWGAVFALRIQDESMSPTLMAGDIAVIKMSTKIKSDQLIALHVNRSPLMIRKIVKYQNKILLQPHNLAYDSQIFDMKKDQIHIIGQVVYAKRQTEYFFNEV